MTEKVITHFFSLVIYCLVAGVCAEFVRSDSWFPDWNWRSFFKTNPYTDDWNRGISDIQLEDTPTRYFSNNYQENVNFLSNVITQVEANGITYQLPVNAREYEPSNTLVTDFGTYDFIIVGAGAGGSVLANRLSEIKQWKILLIEAGDYGDNVTDIPNLFYQVEFTKYNWGFNSVPQKTACLGMINFNCPMARGKGVGGSTLINGMVHARGSKIDFDRWAERVGDYTWSYEQVLPYFQRSENFVHRDRDAPVVGSVHGTRGPLSVEYHLPRSPQLNVFLKANEELHYTVADYNAGTGLGVSPVQVTTRNGRRYDTGTAFIIPVRDRDNLRVLTNSYVTKVLIDRTRTARGVIFTHKKRYYQVKATYEVIISAGAFQTPQLLMLSGIGPKQHLEALDIPVIQNLEVGSRLRDHPTYYGVNFGTNYTEPILSLQHYIGEFLNGFGALAAPANNQGVGFYESQFTRDRDAPVVGSVHGTRGPLSVEYHLPRSPQLNVFLKANEELHYTVADYNAGTGLGVSPVQVTTRNGRRYDTGTAFIIPVRDRDNLRVLTNSYVTKVLIDRTRTARGVIFTHKKRYYQVKATYEVIISAGAFQTPQLLMLSGIGPKQHLEALDIPVIQNLEVGSRLRDHPTYYGVNFGTNYTEPILSLQHYIGEFLNGFGALAAPANNQGVGFYESQFTRGTGYPDVELLMVAANATNDFTQRAFLLTNSTYEDVWKYNNRAQTFVYNIVALHTESYGTVRLRSRDPFEYPLIDNRFLSDPEGRDIAVIYEGVLLTLRLASTRPMREIGATLQGHPMRACEHLGFPSRSYWYCAIRQMTVNIYHPVGTCPMGPNPYRGDVVDSECKVHGINKLRVVDASVFPFTLAGHPVAPTVMIGEKISDLIKYTYL